MLPPVPLRPLLLATDGRSAGHVSSLLTKLGLGNRVQIALLVQDALRE